MTQAAPFHHDVAEGPDSGHAVWASTSDGVRVRLAIWPGGDKGTVLLFPGRTEYIEKYGRAAGDLVARGYAVIAIDWRGQGLADRAAEDRNAGYVMHFSDYQKDVAAMAQTARNQGLPKPWYLLAHSMGGCIGLRALMDGLPVRAAAFTAPMWGIAISGFLRPVAWVLSGVSSLVGLGQRYTPGTKPDTYVREAAFQDNVLTTDPEMFAYMQRQIATHPELALGGPSMRWLFEALKEARDLAAQPSPPVPTLTFLGTNERVVDTAPIHDRMARWPDGRLEIVDGAEHEVLMETPAIRAQALDQIDAHFSAHA